MAAAEGQKALGRESSAVRRDNTAVDSDNTGTFARNYTLQAATSQAGGLSLPCMVGDTVCVTEDWDPPYSEPPARSTLVDMFLSEAPETQWLTLRKPFPERSGVAWRWITHATHDIDGAEQHSIYVAAYPVINRPTLFVYHFASAPGAGTDEVASGQFMLHLNEEPTVPHAVQAVWQVCSPAIKTILSSYFNIEGLDVHLYLLPRMTAPYHKYLLNLLAFLLGEPIFDNKIQMNAMLEASRALALRFQRPHTDWFASEGAKIQEAEAWRFAFLYQNEPGDAELTPDSDYTFSKDHLLHGIPTCLYKDPAFPELARLLWDWRTANKSTSTDPENALLPKKGLIDMLPGLWSDQHSIILSLAQTLLRTLDPNAQKKLVLPRLKEERTTTVLPRLPGTEQEAEANRAAMTVSIAEEQPTPTETLLQEAENLIASLTALKENATTQQASFEGKLRNMSIGLSDNDAHAAENMAKRISLLVFELKFTMLFFEDKFKLLLSTKLNHRDPHQIRQFFLGCYLLAEDLIELAKKNHPQLASLSKRIDALAKKISATENASAADMAKRVTLLTELREAKAKASDVNLCEKWRAIFLRVKFSMLEAKPTSSFDAFIPDIFKASSDKASSGSNTLSVTMEDATQRSIVQRSDVSTYIKSQEWFKFIRLLQELVYALNQDGGKTPEKKLARLVADPALLPEISPQADNKPVGGLPATAGGGKSE